MWRKSEDYSHCMQLSKWLQQLLGMFECLNSPLHDCAALVVCSAGVTTHWSCLTVSFFLFLLSCIAFAAGGDNADLGGRWLFFLLLFFNLCHREMACRPGSPCLSMAANPSMVCSSTTTGTSDSSSSCLCVGSACA